MLFKELKSVKSLYLLLFSRLPSKMPYNFLLTATRCILIKTTTFLLKHQNFPMKYGRFLSHVMRRFLLSA
jgi:hypothetical protein